MIARRQALKTFALGSALLNQHLFERIALAETAATPASATTVAQPAEGVIVRQMLMQPFAEPINRVAAVMVIEYAPGAASPPEPHAGAVFGYVLQGKVEIGVDLHSSITYGEGDIWYEAPRQTHRVSRNASATEPAKILAFLIAEKGRTLEPAKVSS
jgi:quercetin dioxygenase-like cupin family protein